MKIPVIFDVDTGVDDAIAIMFAIKSQKLDIKFFCSCMGNTTADNAMQNTLDILDLVNAPDIDVVKGATKGFKRTRVHETVAHGKNGLGDVKLPKNNRKPCKTNYITKYYDTLINSKRPITIVCLGPLTNIANLLEKHPDARKKIKKIIFMGSSLDKVTSDTPYAGFNVKCDPEALEFVLKQKVNIVFCPNNHGKKHIISSAEISKIDSANEKGAIIAKLFKGYHDHFIKNGASTYDSTAIFALLYRYYTHQLPVFMEVKYFPKLDTALAIPHFWKKPNAKIVTKIYGKKFIKKINKMLKTL